MAFHYVICKRMVLTRVVKEDSYFIFCYPEAGGELETLSFFGSGLKDDMWTPELTSHPKGLVAVLEEKSIIYL